MSDFQRRFCVCSWEHLVLHIVNFQGSKQQHPIFHFQSKVEEMDKLPHSLFIVFNATLLVKCKIAKYIVVVKGDNLINSAELQ